MLVSPTKPLGGRAASGSPQGRFSPLGLDAEGSPKARRRIYFSARGGE